MAGVIEKGGRLEAPKRTHPPTCLGRQAARPVSAFWKTSHHCKFHLSFSLTLSPRGQAWLGTGQEHSGAGSPPPYSL